jgi:ABC-type microcin C transport system duplicated ATPase subunit YejF
MRKRAGLARALALDPELLFLDEPTAGLDPIGAAKFDRLTRDLKETLGLTVFLITHDLDTLYEICDRVAVIADKRIIAVGTIPELIATGHPWIEEYFNGPRGRAAHAAHTTLAIVLRIAHGLHTLRRLLGCIDHGDEQSLSTQIQILFDQGGIAHRHPRYGVVDGIGRNGLKLLLNALQIVGRMLAINQQPIKARHGAHLSAVTAGQAQPQANLGTVFSNGLFKTVDRSFHDVSFK